ncbi:hypothetical protein J8F10_09420 [Gemmata sp. G18]|uniref:Uncharacterized protein n=1 Tax=Gemmata palustris TaxID=2822762 RepID=A0ABS5BPA0_9BACT|nr:hypothetical protein [Gemmata palustris]MBP3955500.1 hypothetical protein [Gemmata palustris]
MAIRIVEAPDSGDVHYGASGGGQTLRYTAHTTAGENKADIFLYALAGTVPFLNGFIRNDLKVDSKDGAPNVFTVTVEYGTTGVGGSDQPLGGVGSDGSPPTNATAPAAPNTPLTSGWSFSIQAPTLHITQSKETVDRAKRGGGVPRNFRGAIGVSMNGPDMEVEGCDVPPPASFTFKRTVPRANVTQEYLDTLSQIAGKPNDADFYFWKAGEVLLQSADGTYTQGEGWSITFQFGIEKNNDNVIICGPSAPGAADGLPAIPGPGVLTKRGWDYMWVLYGKTDVSGQMVKQPEAVYIERVFDYADYSRLEIG